MPTIRRCCLLLIWEVLFAQSPKPVDMDNRYRMKPKSLLAMRDRQDVPAMRRHAWELFKGINEMVMPQFPIPLPKVPVWLTWNTKQEVFTGQPASFFQKFEIPEQFLVFAREFLNDKSEFIQLKDLDTTQIPLSTIFLNPATAGQMRARTPVPGVPGVFAVPAVPQTIEEADRQFTIRGITGTARQLAPFPDESLAVKTAWKLISAPNWEGNPIPVWHEAGADGDPTKPLKPDQWKDRVRVDPRKARHPCFTVERACQNLPPRDAPATPSSVIAKLPVVQIDRFFYVPVCTCDQAATLQAKFIDFFGVYPGDYIVLMGLHLTTREIPDWVWTTFWWSDNPQHGEFSRNRPPFYPSPWKNYLMDTTLDMVTPRNSRGKGKTIYNPWLEVVTMPLHKAIESNCMSCHRVSAYPRIPFIISGLVDPAGKDLHDKTKLDFLWTIGTQFPNPK